MREIKAGLADCDVLRLHLVAAGEDRLRCALLRSAGNGARQRSAYQRRKEKQLSM